MRSFCFGICLGVLVSAACLRRIEPRLRTESPVAPPFASQRIVRADVRLNLNRKNVLVVGGTCAFVAETIARNEIAWVIDLRNDEQTKHHDACVSAISAKRIEFCDAPQGFKHLRSFSCGASVDAIVSFESIPDHLKLTRPQIIVYQNNDHRERDDDWLKSESFACFENDRETICASFAI